MNFLQSPSRGSHLLCRISYTGKFIFNYYHKEVETLHHPSAHFAVDTAMHTTFCKKCLFPIFTWVLLLHSKLRSENDDSQLIFFVQKVLRPCQKSNVQRIYDGLRYKSHTKYNLRKTSNQPKNIFVSLVLLHYCYTYLK